MTRCRCGAKWTGLKICHCSVCHELFFTPRAFDAHRVGSVDNRRCDLRVRDSQNVNLLYLDSAGYWHYGQPGFVNPGEPGEAGKGTPDG